jgi:hypothetical protein
MELLQRDFIRLGEGNVQFLLGVSQTTAQSLGGEVQAPEKNHRVNISITRQIETIGTYLFNHKRPSVAVLFFSGASVASRFSRVLLAVGLERKRSRIF